MANVIIIRYDNPRDLGTDVANRRGKYLVYGVDSEEVGPVSQDAVGKLIENVSDTRDRQLPQRGDQPKFAVDVGTGLYVNKGYSCTSDGVKGRILELMPLEGVQFIHRDWNIVKSCRPRDVSRQAAKLSSWAMSCIQMDLRHHIGRVSGTTTLDGRGGILLHDVIRCDEGGWVSIDDLVRMEVLWTARSRDITESANVRDRDQRMRLYNERLQLIINGKLLNARKQGGKIRLQFLGVRLKEPPAGPYNLGAAGSNMMVSRQDQSTELQRDHNTRHEQQWLGQCDGWIRPWAVRALSGHAVHYDPAKNLMELDPHKFAICPPLSLVNQIGGAFHATSCRNLFSIVERGILPGTSIQDDQYARLQGRITDRGNIIVNRPVPFNLVKEVGPKRPCANQLGYSRQSFNPQTYIDRGQGPKEMHFSCLGLLNELIPKVTGYTMYSLIRPAPSRPTAYLYIDPVGVVLIMSLRETSADTLAFLVDHDVQVPAKFVDKITKRKIDAETNPQHHTKRVALKHLDHADYMGEGQQSLQKNALALLAQSIPSLLHQREHHQPDATPGNQPLAT
eukprot:s4429_g2.t2